jgi:hypothetical protein
MTGKGCVRRRMAGKGVVHRGITEIDTVIPAQAGIHPQLRRTHAIIFGEH